jgi:hypothetical protein
LGRNGRFEAWSCENGLAEALTRRVADAAEALRVSEARHLKGKVVLRVR